MGAPRDGRLWDRGNRRFAAARLEAMMKAVRFHGPKDVRVEDVPGPDAELDSTKVLLRPRFCGICGSDLREYLAGPIDTTWDPHPLTGTQLPQILGHEFSADVVAVGAAVQAVEPGDRVAVMPAAYCGECGPCRRGLEHMCARAACVGLSWPWGGLAELAVVEEYQVALLPEQVSYEQGALIEPAAVAINAVDRGQLKPGAVVLITGLGPIGALNVLAARGAGAARVFVSEPNSRRAALATSLGADAVFDPTSTDVSAEIRERSDGFGADVALESSGNGAALRTCLQATRTRGTVVQVGLHTGDVAIDAIDLTERELALVGAYAYDIRAFPDVTARVAAGELPVERIVTSNVALEDSVDQGLEALIDPEAGEIKILVET